MDDSMKRVFCGDEMSQFGLTTLFFKNNFDCRCLLVMYKRIVSQRPEYVYMKTQLIFEEETDAHFDAVFYKSAIVQAVKSVYGEVGASVNIDLIKYTSCAKEAILRVPYSAFVRVQSALTLCATYQGKDCTFRVLQISPHLMSLAVNSRDM